MKLLTRVGKFFFVVSVMLSMGAVLLGDVLPTSCGFGGIIDMLDMHALVTASIIISAAVSLLSFSLRYLLTKKVDDRHHIASM